MQPDSNRIVESEEAGASRILWPFVIGCAIAISVFLYAAFVWRKAPIIVVSGIFAAFAVAILVRQVVQSRMLRKFGNVVLQLEGPEPAIGGRLAGSIVLPAEVAAASVLVEFTCRRTSYAYGKKPLTGTVWARRPRIPVRNGAVAISFDIPAELQPTRLRDPDNPDDLKAREFREWSLRVYAELPGPDLDYSYPIIVQPALPGTEAAMPLNTDAAAAAPDPTGTAVPGTTPAAHDARSTWVLVAANLVPAVGIAFWGWKVQDMMILYWIETVVMFAFAALYLMLAYDWNPVMDKVNAEHADLDLDPNPNPKAIILAKLGASAIYIVLLGLLCAWIGSMMAALFFKDAPLLKVFSGFMREPDAIFAVLAIVGYHAYAFFRDYNDDMLARPFFRVLVMYACMVVLFLVVSMVGSKFPVVTGLVYVAFKVYVEIRLRRGGREQSAGKQVPLPIQQNLVEAPPPLASQEPAPPPVATQRPVLRERQQDAKPQPVRHDLNGRPLAHYMGAWRLAPGQLETPGWFAGAEFHSEAGKLKLRLTDQAGIGDAPDALESVNVRGNPERIEFIQVRLKSGGTQRILRFTASGADPDRIDLNEVQHPVGNPKAMQARSYSLRKLVADR